MDSLDQQIRDWIARRPRVFPGLPEDSPTRIRQADWTERSAAALLAVLKTHAPWEVGHPDEPDYVCQTCRYFTSAWPCPTVDDIAEALRVEEDGD